MMDNWNYVQILLLFVLYEFIKYALVKSKNYVKLEKFAMNSTPIIQSIRRIITTTNINISGLSLLSFETEAPLRRSIIYSETPKGIPELSVIKPNCKGRIRNRQMFCKAKRTLRF